MTTPTNNQPVNPDHERTHLPADLHATADLADALGMAERRRPGPGFEARLFARSTPALLSGEGESAARTLRTEQARLLDAAPSDLEVVTFERSKGELPRTVAHPPLRITDVPSLKAPQPARSLRTVWRVAAMVAIIGGGTAAYLATTGGGPSPVPGTDANTADVAAAEEAVLDALDGLEADFSGDQLDSLMAEAAGLERVLESGLIDDDVLLEKGAM